MVKACFNLSKLRGQLLAKYMTTTAMDKENLGPLEKWSQLIGMEWFKSDELGPSSEN